MSESYLQQRDRGRAAGGGQPGAGWRSCSACSRTACARATSNCARALEALAAEYEGRGIELKETASGFRIQVRRELAAEISRLWPERAARYSRALLETLALIAYRQPITRAEIEAVRGVAVNPNIIRTVIERNWVRVVGHRDVPGPPGTAGHHARVSRLLRPQEPR